MPTKNARENAPFKDLNASDTKMVLHNALENIKSGGSFATSGVYSEAPVPDLSLEGFGPIPLPLAERDAEAICKEQIEGDKGKRPLETWFAKLVAEIYPAENVSWAEKSVNRDPGKNSEKFLHNQWEMKTDKLDVRNPAWNKFVQGVATKAAEDMGVRSYMGAIRADMNEARLWAVGACMAPYKEYFDWLRVYRQFFC